MKPPISKETLCYMAAGALLLAGAYTYFDPATDTVQLLQKISLQLTVIQAFMWVWMARGER